MQRIVLFLLLLLTLTGCSVSDFDREDIDAVLDMRSLTIERKDTRAFKTIVASTHPDRAKIVERFGLNSQFFKMMKYELVQRTYLSKIPFSNKVQVEQTFNLSFQGPEDEKPTILKNRKEKITLEKFELGWKIIDGLK